MDTTTLGSDDDAPRGTSPNTQEGAPPGFVLLDEVGRGGMGAVWRARDLALDREVAVKLLQERFEPGSSAAVRFVEEARITGQLQHPGIPAVYQVGTLPSGRPYLAMKLIRGKTLNAILRAGAPFDALSVFEAIAQAVGYAHAHDVIHRDLKPENVMVGGFGEVQVMDWGLAKVLTGPTGGRESPADPEATAARTQIRSPRDSDSDQTQDGSVLGTPAYMAPEQAAGEIDKVDARSDVFGLGAILCVLLTGRPPFGGHDLHEVHRAAMRGRTGEAFARLDGCGADPDVVALCKRCLAFDPADRPEAGNAVAEAVAGLRRAADDRARQAERDKHTAEVRAAEQVKRRRAVQWAAGVVVGVLLLGMIGTGLGLYRAEMARRKAVIAEQATELKRREAETARTEEAKQKALAQAKEAEANAVVKFFEDHVFAAGRPKGQEGGRGSDVSLHDAIMAGLPALAKAFPDQPLVEARLRLTLGNTFFYLGETRRAAEQFERALALFTREHGPEHPDTLSSMQNLASSHAELGRHDEALKLRQAALEVMSRTQPSDDPRTLSGMNNLANSYADAGRHDKALELFEKVLAARKRTLPPDHPDTLTSMGSLANCYDALDRRAEAIRLNEEALAARKRVLPPDHPDTLTSLFNLAAGYKELGRHDEALKLHEEALAARKRVLPPDHPDTLASMNGLASSYAALGRQAEALKLLEEVLAARKRVLPPDHPDTLLSMHNLALGLAAFGRHDEALKLREEVLAARRRTLKPEHVDTLLSMHDLALSYAQMGRHDEAVELFEKVLAARSRTLPPDDPDLVSSMNNLALGYARMGRHDEALKLFEEVLAARRRTLPPDDPGTLSSMNNLANSYAEAGRQAEALKLREETLAAMKRVLPPDHLSTLVIMNNLAVSYSNQGRNEEALKLREEVLAARRRVLPPDHPHTLLSMNNLALSYTRMGRHAEALKLREEVLAARKRLLPPEHPDTLSSVQDLAEAYLVVHRDAEAIALIDDCLSKAAGKAVDPSFVADLMDVRLRHFQKVGDPAGCRATAVLCEKLNPTDANSLYNAACCRAVVARVQTKAGGDDADRLARDDADRAMAWLAKAVAAGFRDRAHMEKDVDLDALRDRDDFKTLMTNLDAKTPAPPP